MVYPYSVKLETRFNKYVNNNNVNFDFKMLIFYHYGN